LGARDFLEKPIDSTRFKAFFYDLIEARDPLWPLVNRLRETPLGERGERLYGDSPAFLDVLRQVAKVTQHPDCRVLLTGESGTGKELLARAIHRLGASPESPWIAVNVGEIPPTLIESALFGHERGSFTDAKAKRIGFLEMAGDGALFLDEIGDLDVALQVKLLRVIQEREFRRIGGSETIAFRARLISATNRDLAAAVGEGSFRRDLFHRISEVTVNVPPLRERRGDVDLLLKHFLDVHRGTRVLGFSRETLSVLRSYPFSGNVRELENIVRNAVIECEGDTILPRHLPLQTMREFLRDKIQEVPVGPVSSAPGASPRAGPEPEAVVAAGGLNEPYKKALAAATRAFDRLYFARMLEHHRHNLARAARAAGLDAKTFRKHYKDCGLPPLRGGKEGDGA
jgi:two-component system response regulator AtoC